MDRFESMVVFVTIVEAGSLSSASRHLGMPIASVSRKLSDLEVHLKTKLLNRSRHASLTESGRPYFEACKRILEDLGEAERTAIGEYRTPKGDLLITAPVAFGRLHVLPIVIDFLAAHPDINVRLLQADRVAHLQDEHIDVAIRIGHMPDSALIATQLGAIRRVVCASPSYFASRGKPEKPNDLLLHDCVVFDSPISSSEWTFHIGKTRRSVSIRSRLVVNTAEAAIDAAIAGLGIVRVLSYQAEEALGTSALELALELFEPPPSPVSIVHIESRLLPMKVRAFLDFATPRLKSRLSSIAALG